VLVPLKHVCEFAFQERHDEEQKLSRQSIALKMAEWRTKLRAAKAQELTQQIDIMAQTHSRQVDRRDAILEMLDRDLDEAENQYQMALRSHIKNVDNLIEIQNQRLQMLEEELEDDMDQLQKEFLSERAEIVAAHNRKKEELERIILSMELEYKAQCAKDESAVDRIPSLFPASCFLLFLRSLHDIRAMGTQVSLHDLPTPLFLPFLSPPPPSSASSHPTCLVSFLSSFFVPSRAMRQGGAQGRVAGAERTAGDGDDKQQVEARRASRPLDPRDGGGSSRRCEVHVLRHANALERLCVAEPAAARV